MSWARFWDRINRVWRAASGSDMLKFVVCKKITHLVTIAKLLHKLSMIHADLHQVSIYNMYTGSVVSALLWILDYNLSKL